MPEPVLVGRKHELEELQSFLDLAIKGQGNTVFISGEAGAGKTRLLTEFLSMAKKREVTVLTGWCLSDAVVPYFPFVEAFDSYFSTNEEEEASAVNLSTSLKSWLKETNQPDPSERFSDVPPQAWRDQAFGAVTKELLFLSAKKPLILALEDIHWADSASLSLLQYLARQVGSERILILATFRSEELSADAEGHPNPLSKVLRLMGRDSLYVDVKLPNLSIEDVKGIAKSMLGGTVDQTLVEKLASDSHGNPLFVVESLRMLFQQGNLSKKNGQWSLCIDTYEIPPKVKDIILQRLETLPPDQRKILDVCSVVGEKFDPKLVAAAVSLDNADVLIALNKIAKSALMVHCDGDFYKFSQSKSREMLYAEIPPLLKKEYHSRIAEKIETYSQNIAGASVNDLAYHNVQAGNKTKAITYSLQAGKLALSRFSNAEAIRHFSYVANTSEENGEFINERVNALEGLGDAYYVNSMYKEAERTFLQLADTAQMDTVKLRALRKAIQSAFQLGHTSQLTDLLKKAEPYAGADRLENARVLASKGKVFVDQKMYALALECEEAALRVFEEEYSLWDVAQTLMGMGFEHVLVGKTTQGLAEGLRSIALWEELGDVSQQMVACHLTGGSFLRCLLEQEALDTFGRIIEIDEKTKLGNYQILVYGNCGISLVFEGMGNFEKALSYSLKALEASSKTDSLVAQAMAYSNLVVQYTKLGLLKRAEEYFQKLVKLPPEILSNRFVQVVPVKAVLLAGKNQWKGSNQYFKEWLESTKALPGAWRAESRMKLFYAWALERQGRSEEALVQLKERDEIRQEAKERFEHVNVQANLMAPARVKVGQTFEARLDIVNVSEGQGILLRIENMLNPKLTVTCFPQGCALRNDTIDAKETAMTPFQVKTIKLSLQANQPGEIKLDPKVVYIDDLGKTQTCTANSVCITAQAAATSTEAEKVAELPKFEFKFKSEDAQKALDFLIKAFLDDYVNGKLPLERSGWRTLMELVKKGKISRYGAYRSHGYGRKAVSELEQRGLVEARIFSGERGRGGKILKLRVSYKNEALKGRLIAEK